MKTAEKDKREDPLKTRILLVDDEVTLRNFLKEGLENFGFECMVASDGLEALGIMEQSPCEIIVTDISMPHMDGIELTEKVKARYDVDVIVMTGLMEEYTYNKIMGMGASDFLEKPVSIQELVLRLRRVFRERANIQNRNRAERELRESVERLRVVIESIVEAMTLAIEKRDPYTSGHQRRVASLAGAVAGEMELPRDQIDGIRIAAMLHDIGKISIPGEILGKPGILTGPEMAMIREHPRTGYDILKGIEFPWPVSQMVLQHHERIDGSGYPQGLSDKEINLGAKILMVADTFEAMVSHRPYRASRGSGKAIQELSEKRGILYAPVVVDACLKVVTSKDFSF